MKDDTPVLIYSTFPDPGSARAAAGILVERKLAACVNMLPGMRSVYLWQGAVEEAEEVVFIAKTVRAGADAAMAAIADAHPYDEPALLVLPTAGGSVGFCGWIREQVLTDPAA